MKIHKLPHILLLAMILIIYITCKDRESTNPFDAACPKEIFTPSDFKAEQDGNTIKISWVQENTNISGFVINRNENDGVMTEVTRVDKTVTSWNDTNVKGGTKYGYKLAAYAGDNQSNTVSTFITPVYGATVTTDAVSDITSTSAVMGGNVTNEGGATVTERGVCYSTAFNPTTSSTKLEIGSGTGPFSLSITGLTTGITYYVRAYAINSQGTTYGTQVTFTTNFITVTPASYNAPKESGSKEFTVASNVEWQVTSNQTWCTLNANSGKGNGTITVTYPENKEVPQRTASITFTGSGVASQTSTLTQNGTEPLTLYITPENQNVTNVAGATTFAITSNVSWTAQNDQNWCTVTNTSGTGNATLNVNYEANTTNSQRVANLTISGIGLTPTTITLTQQSAIPTDGLVAYYPFNGNANDESGNGNNGIVTGATLTTDRNGKIESAYLFDGATNYIKILGFGNKMPEQEITLSIWTNTITVQPNFVICMNEDNGGNRFGVHLNYAYLGQIYWDYGNIYGSGRLTYDSPNAIVNKWENWVFISSYSNNLMKVYRNGILEKVINTSTYFSRYNADLIIGGMYTFFNGFIDDIRIYERTLTETEIQQLYKE